MATFEFKLPDIGEGVVEGEIVKWLVKEGDSVSEDQPLVEVMTDKATVTIPSPKRGRVLKTFGAEGSIAKVHNPLVSLDIDSGAAAKPAPIMPAAQPAPPISRAAGPAVAERGLAAAPQVARSASTGGNGSPGASAKVLATPVTRRMAREHGLNLQEIAGTGAQGRVTKADVVAAIGSSSGATPLSSAGATARPAQPFAALTVSQADQRIPLKGLRRRIAEKMVRSKFTAPHYTFVEEMDATKLVALRASANELLAASGETAKVSFLPFICKALVATFKKFPTLNANFDEATQELVVRSAYNFGIAAATDEGLTVPVIKDVDRRSIRDLAVEIQRLATAARERRLRLDELSGGTFTITSLGEKSGLLATPIINHPEVAILGVHRIRKRPVVVENDQIAVREMMYLSLSFDHRVIDGALGAEFTYGLIRYLENPEILFVELT